MFLPDHMVRKTLPLVILIISLTGSFNLLSQNLKIDGYRGIWFSSGKAGEYGYKFSGGVATFAARHTPIAIFSPEVRKTFFVYGGTTKADEQHLLTMISYYDHRLNQVPKPIIVYDKMGVREPYDNASLSIDSNGYLWVFISGRIRTRPGLIFKSSEPYSIEKFDKIEEWEMNSPQPWWIDGYGFLLMFSRTTNGRELYFSSSTDGISWSQGKKIAGMGGHYQVSNVLGNKLFTVFNYHPDGNTDARTNLYLLKTEDMGKTWETVNGQTLEIPVTNVNSEALIKDYRTEGKLVHINDLNFDKSGNPVILVVLSNGPDPGPEDGPREWTVISWKDNKWNFCKVCESSNNFDMGSLYIDGDRWRIIGPTEPGPQKYGTGGEIALWESNDEGNSWNKIRNITSGSRLNNSFLRRPVDTKREFYALWTDGNADKLSASHLYFTNDKCDRIWELPYEMKNDLEKPVRKR
jgi:hypothetical protein